MYHVVYASLLCCCALLIYGDVLSLFDMYYNTTLVVRDGEWWRLVTSFCRGPVGTSPTSAYMSFRYYVALFAMTRLHRRWHVYVLAWLGCLVLGSTTGYTFFDDMFTTSMITLWSRTHTTIRIGQVHARARHIPLYLACSDYVLMRDLTPWTFGWLVGHAVALYDRNEPLETVL